MANNPYTICIHVYIYACRKQRASTESRNRDECSGDRLPVARVT